MDEADVLGDRIAVVSIFLLCQVLQRFISKSFLLGQGRSFESTRNIKISEETLWIGLLASHVIERRVQSGESPQIGV